MHEDELQAYCARHNLEVIETYHTLGETGYHYRAVVRERTTGEGYRLYYDRSRRRRTLARQKADYDIYIESGVQPTPKARGWRNVTLDNRNSRAREQRKRDDFWITHQAAEDERARDILEGCDGLCQPEYSLYEAKCPLHGLAVLIDGLSGTSDV